jgi:hypothetical protein
VICLDEIKMNLLGKSCICPGFSTVICNLMISASAAQGTEFEPWFQEYVSGCGQEIYCTNISPQLAGKFFSQAVLLLYRECNCLLFAIEIVDKEGFSRVVLNPATYVIPDTSPKVFLIAQVPRARPTSSQQMKCLRKLQTPQCRGCTQFARGHYIDSCCGTHRTARRRMRCVSMVLIKISWRL